MGWAGACKVSWAGNLYKPNEPKDRRRKMEKRCCNKEENKPSYPPAYSVVVGNITSSLQRPMKRRRRGVGQENKKINLKSIHAVTVFFF